jgi:MFS family permease
MPTGPNTSCKGRYFTNNAYLSPIPLNFNSTSGIGWYFHLQPTIDQPLANQSQPTIKIRQPTIGWLITGLATFWQRSTKLWTHKPYRRSILTVSMTQVFGQFTGYNTLLYYSGTLFGLLGLSNPSIGGLIPSITNTFFLLLCMVMVDRIGRRGLLMRFGPIMAVGLLWCLIAFTFMCKDTGHVLLQGHEYPQKAVGLVIAGIVVFVTGFGSTYAHLCWYQ